MNDAPEKYKQAGMLMLVAGLVSVMTGALSMMSGFVACLSTYGLCCFCPAIGVIPIVTGTLEMIAGNQMRAGLHVPNARMMNMTGLIMSVITFSIIGVVLEAIVMAQLNDPEVTGYLGDRGPADSPL